MDLEFFETNLDDVKDLVKIYITKYDIEGLFGQKGINAISELFYEIIQTDDEILNEDESRVQDPPYDLHRPRGKINRASISDLALWLEKEVRDSLAVKNDINRFYPFSGEPIEYENAKNIFRKHLNRVYITEDTEVSHIFHELFQVRGWSILEQLRDWICVYGTPNQQKTMEERIWRPITEYNESVSDFCFNEGPWPKNIYDTERMASLLKLLAISIKYPDPDDAVNETLPEIIPEEKIPRGPKRRGSIHDFVRKNASRITIPVDPSGREPLKADWARVITTAFRTANRGKHYSYETVFRAIDLPLNPINTNGAWTGDWSKLGRGEK